MKNIFTKLLLFVSLLLYAYGANAENVFTDLSVKPSTSSSKAVVVSQVIYNLSDVDVDFSLSCLVDDFKEGSAQGEFVLKLNGSQESKAAITLKKDGKEGNQTKLSGNGSITNLTKSGTYTLECKVEWKDSKSKPVTITKSVNFEVKLFDTPEVTTASKKYVLFSGSSKNLALSVKGGYASGWKYEWVGTSNSTNQYTYTASNSGSSKKTDEVKVNVKNYAPDGKTVWGEISKTFTFDVWSKPTSKLTNEGKLEVISGETFSLSVNTEGGDPSAWRYAWTLDGKNKGHQQTIESSCETTYHKTFTFQLEVSNKPAGMEESDAYKEVLEYAVDCWDIPTLTAKGEANPVVFSGETVNLGVNPQGGNSEGWTYKWSNGDHGNQPEISFSAENVGDELLTKKVNVEATNRTPSGKVLLTKKVDFTVGIWKTPTVTVVGEQNFELLKGDVANFEVKVDGGDANAWTYEWKQNSSPVGGNSNKFEFNTQYVSASNEGTLYVHKLVATNTPKGINKAFSKEFEFKTKVWLQPSYISHKAKEEVTCSGRQNELALNLTGGASRGWVIQWTKNGQPLSDVKTPIYKYKEEDVGEKVENDYTVSANYMRNGESIFSKECSFHVQVWPKPVVVGEVKDIDEYRGETVNTPMEITGGYPEGWKYTMTVDEEPVENVDTEFGFVIPSEGEDGQQYKVVCEVTNGYNGINWVAPSQSRHRYYLTAWSKGEVTVVPMDSIDGSIQKTSVRHSSPVVLKSNVKGGYEQGWDFSWTKNEDVLPDENNSTLSFTANNKGTDFLDDEYVLHYSNQLNEKVGTQGDLVYNMRIWAEAQFPENIEGPSNVRSGNQVVFSVTSAEYGYCKNSKENWKYDWKGYDVNSNKLSFIAQSTKGYSKGVEEHTYQLSVSNKGAVGHIWDSKNYQHTMKIYNSPETPAELLIKGNGTSCTMIATFNSLNSDLLKSRDYIVVFGYTEHDQDVTFEAEENLCYKKFTKEIFNKIQWVYAKWIYSDGSVVTSGKCYLNGKRDLLFDGSVYASDNRSPSDQTGVENTPVDEINIVGNKFVATLSKKMPARISLYNVSGRLVSRKMLAASSEFNENLYTEQLQSGVYMVEIIVGSKREVRKIYVH